MKRFIIRQVSLILALVMLLSLTGMTEELSANDVDVQAIGLDGLSLDDLFIDGELDLEIDPNAGVDLTLDEITLDEIPGEAVDGGVDVEVEGVEGDVLIDEAIDQTGLDPQGSGVSGSQAQYSLPGADSDNAALADAYLRGVLPGFGKGGRTFASPNAGRKALAKKGLTGSVAVYDAVKPMIVAVAEGQRTSTVFELDAAALGTTDHWWSAADLGVADLSDPYLGDRLLTKEGVDSWEIVTALLEDCPYHLYWFDKTLGWSYGYYYSTQGDMARLESVSLSLCVSSDYAAGTYEVNALPARISAAVTNINKTVNDNKGLGDLEKVTAYADAVCGYV